jgi:hypothetical protein
MLCRAAHWHADQGLFVFPLAPGRKVPAVEKDWEAAATTNHLTIAHTWQQAPYNIGVATGPSTLAWFEQPRTWTGCSARARTEYLAEEADEPEYNTTAWCSLEA